MARLYSNENFPKRSVDALRRLGHDVLTVFESGHANMRWPDEEVLRFATRDSRVVITLNRKHFIRLHQTQPEHAGIVVCTSDPDRRALAERVHQALVAVEEMNGQLLRVVRPRT
jgi:predicted nuclease of predicted toxin-antitoxin system